MCRLCVRHVCGVRREAELRLSMLALLECVLKQREVTEEALRPYAVVLLRDIVVANAVWRAGMVAATVRKVNSIYVLVVPLFVFIVSSFFLFFRFCFFGFSFFLLLLCYPFLFPVPCSRFPDVFLFTILCVFVRVGYLSVLIFYFLLLL